MDFTNEDLHVLYKRGVKTYAIFFVNFFSIKNQLSCNQFLRCFYLRCVFLVIKGERQQYVFNVRVSSLSDNHPMHLVC